MTTRNSKASTSKLTKRFIDSLEPRDKSFTVRDGKIPGFLIRVMPSGVMSFWLEYRPYPGGRGVPQRYLPLGQYGATTPAEARQAALDALAKIRMGADPQAEKTALRASMAVGELIDLYLDHVAATKKPNTKASYTAALTRVRKTYGTVKARSLTPPKSRRCTMTCAACVIRPTA